MKKLSTLLLAFTTACNPGTSEETETTASTTGQTTTETGPTTETTETDPTTETTETDLTTETGDTSETETSDTEETSDTTTEGPGCPLDADDNLLLYSQEDVNNAASCSSESLASLEISGGDITDLTPLANLQTVTGVLGIHNNPLLTSLEGLEGITAGPIEIRLNNNPLLENLDGLSGISTPIGSLDIESCPELTSVSGLANIPSQPDTELIITISSAPKLTNLTGLEGMSGSLDVSFVVSAAGIQDLSALSGFTELVYIYLQMLPITDIQDIPTQNAEIIIVDDCPELASLDPLAGLSSLESLSLTILPQVTSLSALESLTSLQVLTLGSMEQVTELPTLAGLTELESLDLSRLGITSMSGLDSITMISEDTNIVVNESLPQTDAEAWADARTLGGFVKIAGNLGYMPMMSCPWVEDGVCDEPEGLDICPVGTDLFDCEP